jgi:hypothetical protein
MIGAPFPGFPAQLRLGHRDIGGLRDPGPVIQLPGAIAVENRKRVQAPAQGSQHRRQVELVDELLAGLHP